MKFQLFALSFVAVIAAGVLAAPAPLANKAECGCFNECTMNGCGAGILIEDCVCSQDCGKSLSHVIPDLN